MIFQKQTFRLGESAILGVRGAELTSRWSYVGTKLAYVGLRLDLYWLKLATVGRKVAYVGPCWAYVGPSRASEASRELLPIRFWPPGGLSAPRGGPQKFPEIKVPVYIWTGNFALASLAQVPSALRAGYPLNL